MKDEKDPFPVESNTSQEMIREIIGMTHLVLDQVHELVDALIDLSKKMEEGKTK